MNANLVEPTVKTNPYVGPQAFRRGDQIYGRDREAADLVDLLVAERIVLLHSPSGAGKTSLIHARLIPLLEQEGFEVLPVVRVSRTPAEALEGPTPVNRYVLSTLLSLEEGLAPEDQHSLPQLSSMALAPYLAQRPDMDGRPDNEIIVFDQFEEVITADPVDQDVKAAFFADLGAMLRDRKLWALFVIREDFLASLDPYVRAIPTRLSTRYRLDLLTADEALDAMTFPAHDAGVEFDTEAARKLVDDLRAIRVQRGTVVTSELGPYVEPVQLQVVCHLMWDRLADDARRIQLSDVQAIGDVDQALAAYYADCVTTASAAAGIPERLLRDWFEQGLITPQGFRGQVMRGPDAPGVSGQAVLKLLTDRHLLRSESRRGAVWYELAHDRLVEPIQHDNEAWRASHLSTFERRATEWESEDRPDRLLLTAEELLEHRSTESGEAQPLTETEREFLMASRKAQEQAEKVVRANARTKRWLVATVIVCVLAFVAAGLAIRSTVEAGQAADRALQSALVGKGYAELDRDTQLGLLLAQEAARMGPPSTASEAAEDATLLQRALSLTPVARVLKGTGSPAVAAAYSADGERIAAVAEDGSVRVWTSTSGALQASYAGIGPVGDMAVSSDGLVVAVATEDGRLAVWDTRRPDSLLADRQFDESVTAMAFGPGERLAYSTIGGTGGVMDVRTGRDERVLESEFSATDMVWRPDGSGLVAVDLLGSLLVWGKTPNPLVTESPVSGWPNTIDISPDGSTVVTGWDTGQVVVHRQGAKPKAYPVANTEVLDVSFTSDGSRLLTLDLYGNVWLLDPVTGKVPLYSMEPGTWPLVIDADPKNAERVVVATGRGDAAIWNVTTGHSAAPTAVDTALDGKVLTSSPDGTARLWSVDSGQRNVVGGIDTTAPAAGADRVVSAQPVVTWDTGLVDAVMDGRGRFVVTLDDLGAVTVTATGVDETGPQLAVSADLTFRSLALSPSGTYLATGDGAQPFAVRVWEVATGRQVRELIGHKDAVTGIAFASDDDLVSIADDQTARVWKRSAGGPRLTLPPTAAYGEANGISTTFTLEDDEFFSHVAWASGDGTLGPIATATHSSVQLWDARTGQLLRELTGHTEAVTDVTFDRSGKRLLTTGIDHAAVVWDAASGTLVRRIQQSDRIMAGAFVSAGDRLALLTQVESGPLLVWLDKDELLEVAAQRTTRSFSQEECERFKEYFTEDRRCPT